MPLKLKTKQEQNIEHRVSPIFRRTPAQVNRAKVDQLLRGKLEPEAAIAALVSLSLQYRKGSEPRASIQDKNAASEALALFADIARAADKDRLLRQTLETHAKRRYREEFGTPFSAGNASKLSSSQVRKLDALEWFLVLWSQSGRKGKTDHLRAHVLSLLGKIPSYSLALTALRSGNILDLANVMAPRPERSGSEQSQYDLRFDPGLSEPEQRKQSSSEYDLKFDPVEPNPLPEPAPLPDEVVRKRHRMNDKTLHALAQDLRPENSLVQDLMAGRLHERDSHKCGSAKGKATLERARAFHVLKCLNSLQLPIIRGDGTQELKPRAVQGAAVLYHIFTRSIGVARLERLLADYGAHQLKRVFGSSDPEELLASGKITKKNVNQLSVLEWSLAFHAMKEKNSKLSVEQQNFVRGRVSLLIEQVCDAFGPEVGPVARRFMRGFMTRETAICLDPTFRALEAKNTEGNFRHGSENSKGIPVRAHCFQQVLKDVSQSTAPAQSELIAFVCNKETGKEAFASAFSYICDLSEARRTALSVDGPSAPTRHRAKEMVLHGRALLAELCRKAQTDDILRSRLVEYGREYFKDRVERVLNPQISDPQRKKQLAALALGSSWIVPVFYALSQRKNEQFKEAVAPTLRLLKDLGYSKEMQNILRANNPSSLIHHIESEGAKAGIDRIINSNPDLLGSPLPVPSLWARFLNRLRTGYPNAPRSAS